jgi:hypothetical protein
MNEAIVVTLISVSGSVIIAALTFYLTKNMSYLFNEKKREAKSL